METLITSWALLASIVTAIFALSPNSLNGKFILWKGDQDPVNIRYIALFKRNMTRVCIGCLVSGRHIVSTAGCIDLLLKNEIDEPQLFGVTALIGRTDHKIIQAIYHSSYKFRTGGYHRVYDVGLALIEDLIFASNEVSFVDLSNVRVESNHVAEIVGWRNGINCTPGLQKMKVKVETAQTCKKSYQSLTYATSKTICATKVNPNDILFKVDNGSPLIQNGLLLGIYSYKTGQKKIPLIFLRTNWLRQYVEETKRILNDM